MPAPLPPPKPLRLPRRSPEQLFSAIREAVKGGEPAYVWEAAMGRIRRVNAR